MRGSLPHLISTCESDPKEKWRKEKNKEKEEKDKKRENGKGEIGKEMKIR